MASLFSAYKANGTTIPTYFIESTAPDNVDDELKKPAPIDPLVLISPDDAIKEIADHLLGATDPNLVVMVHGFNNPQSVVLKLYKSAAAAIASDDAVSSRKGLVCVGYRWPSESMMSPLPSWYRALPPFPTWTLWLTLSVALVGAIFTFVYPTTGWAEYWASGFGHILTVLGLLFAGLVGCAVLLRVIVYFRDTYRATNYGAPDLIEIVRQIDQAIIAHDTKVHGSRANAISSRDGKRVQLSFIGHSMGGYVVTNAIRALSDLFAEYSQRPYLNQGIIEDANSGQIPSQIGHAFNLMRFVLASPDIPAEALLSNRANFLASSLRRFHEAYLFSNEGDEVLRQISTLANYFSFPTTNRRFGYRLGNVEILSSDYGIINVALGSILATVRVGYYTLREIYQILRTTRGQTAKYDTVQDELPERFSYFDCTDYVDTNSEGVERGLLTFALKTKQHDAQARMGTWRHFKLLLAYCLCHQKPDVHCGYFKGALSQRLIYRLACLGYRDTVAAFGGLSALSAECKEKQIRVLFSPGLTARPGAPHRPRGGLIHAP
jgi:hypothetical protein